MQPLLFRHAIPRPGGRRAAIAASHFVDEGELARTLAEEARLDAAKQSRIAAWGRPLIDHARQHPHPLDAFLHEYALASEEGVLLMCLAEGLIRIPDADTADRLIRETLGGARWERHLGAEGGALVNASTWGLMLAGRIVRLDDDAPALLQRLVARSGEGVVREALRRAMHLLARQFVMGRTIAEAVARAGRDSRYRHSFDMLGEAAMSEADALRYAAAYSEAIAALAAADRTDLNARNGLSIKLSALHPRYEMEQRERVLAELLPRLTTLLEQACAAGVPVTLDAEEARRLELSLDIFEAVAQHGPLRRWPGLGLALQTYQPRAPAVLDWLAELAAHRGAPFTLRLVKGAYWDSEIKAAQQQGLPGYPVFTDKIHSDVCYLACARRLLAQPQHFYPQFASHNAHTIAAVRALAGDTPFEYQRLHGMGAALYDSVVAQWGLPCRVYAPVGGHRELLPYLVRRLLENGSNTSFINRIADRALPPERLLADPAAAVLARDWRPSLSAPRNLYGTARTAARGTCLDDGSSLADLHAALRYALAEPWQAGPSGGSRSAVVFPADRRHTVGEVQIASPDLAAAALARAQAAWPVWSRRPLEERAALIRHAGDLLEQQGAALAARIVMEGGRTVPDALAEVREAVDFCRYYAVNALEVLRERTLPGPTGEENLLRSEGRGVFLCISPWNFPVAIFTGQVVAALLAGNTVLAKPAHQTPLCSAAVIALLHQAGIPTEAVQLLPAPGTLVEENVLTAPALAGVAFTGAVDTAHRIQQCLAGRRGPILPFIAETGGQNAMIVDSSALPEQATADILRSAFNSAGQRCSALRVVFVQEEAADRLIEVLTGAMAELRVGDPRLLATDVGPLIDREALQKLETHLAELEGCGRLLARTPLPADCVHGAFLAPCLYEIDDLRPLRTEHFGPVLHLLRYRADDLDAVIDRINHLGYGLTLGVHTRIAAVGRYIAARVEAGNVYINRDMIGAVVGSQPFGGRHLSGTGPKAGGPHYLLRFAAEKTVTTNTAAVGGNAALLGRPQSQIPAAETQRRGEKTQ
jgi:RHH-type proline utilization regulon transcriptional repressor/proline dehydrogenase/delta 1-pyrroline-5-carboxylate dehydrogenase